MRPRSDFYSCLYGSQICFFNESVNSRILSIFTCGPKPPKCDVSLNSKSRIHPTSIRLLCKGADRCWHSESLDEICFCEAFGSDSAPKNISVHKLQPLLHKKVIIEKLAHFLLILVTTAHKFAAHQLRNETTNVDFRDPDLLLYDSVLHWKLFKLSF